MSAMPPDTCPVCGAAVAIIYNEFERDFKCDAFWSNDYWFTPCTHASRAAYRCGATLHPTAREVATQALVAAAEKWQKQWGNDYEPTQQENSHWGNVDKTDDTLWQVVRAYLATVTP